VACILLQYHVLVESGLAHDLWGSSHYSDTHNSDSESLLRPCIPDCIIISYLIATPNNYRIIARSGYWKYDHECRKMHQIKRVCGTCYAHEFNLNAFRHVWSLHIFNIHDVQLIIIFISLTKIKDIDENVDELCFQCSCASMFT
jgi:hypothetical protein